MKDLHNIFDCCIESCTICQEIICQMDGLEFSKDITVEMAYGSEEDVALAKAKYAGWLEHRSTLGPNGHSGGAIE